MECTSPRYVSIPSEVQTCYTLEEKNTFKKKKKTVKIGACPGRCQKAYFFFFLKLYATCAMDT